MKNNLKVICGTVAGFIIGGLTVVGANQAIQALQNTEIKVSLNGVVQNFKDELTGETQYPITYHDRTYLPLRNVAQLAGLRVDWDENSNTALLNNTSSTSYDATTGLEFSDYSVVNWQQIGGCDLFGFFNNNMIYMAHIPLFDINSESIEPEIKEAAGGYKYSQFKTNIGEIEGITTLYYYDEDDLEGGPYSEEIIKFSNGKYGAMDWINKSVTEISVKELKETIAKYDASLEKYGLKRNSR